MKYKRRYAHNIAVHPAGKDYSIEFSRNNTIYRRNKEGNLQKCTIENEVIITPEGDRFKLERNEFDKKMYLRDLDTNEATRVEK